MAAVATAHLTPEKLIKIVGVAMSRTPKLAECSPMSVLSCVMTLAELGLAPNTLGTAYLIPFNNRQAGVMECQLVIGYRGLVELARRSGQLSSLQAEVVREADEWELEFGLDAKLRHVPKGNMKSPIARAYAIARFKDGAHQVAVMEREEIDAIRKQSKAGGGGPWKDHYAEMAKKTVIRRLCKLLPLTPEVESKIAIVDSTEFDFDDIAEAPQGGAAGLAGRILQDEAPPEQEIDPDTGEVIPSADEVEAKSAKK